MKDRMHTGELYLPGDEEILEEQMRCLDRLCDYNMTRPSEMKKREALLAVLAQDPRPSYQSDPGRVYGMAFADWQVRFTVEGERLVVGEIAK